MLFGFVFGSNAIAAERPSIIVILADDLGYSDLGCYGGEIKTPNIDALAAGGAKLTQFYISARCCPSRASLMTGLYPTQPGIGDVTSSKPDPKRAPGYSGQENPAWDSLSKDQQHDLARLMAVFAAMVEGVDVLPTIVEATGAKYPKEFNGNAIAAIEGVSLLP